MGESVKLTDGKYIDTEGVYDATKGETQSAINNRLGTVVSTSIGSSGKYTFTAANETKTVCSLTLPDYGIWLVYGAFQTGAAVRMSVTDGISYANIMAWRNPNSMSGDMVMHAWNVAKGGTTQQLQIISNIASQTISWGNDARFYGIRAVCIG